MDIMRFMKKIILFGALIITAITCYVVGYVMFSFDNPTLNLKEKTYVMPTDFSSEDTTLQEEEYILYPMYGELLIFYSDGKFYDHTGVFLNELSKEEQIEVLQNKQSFKIAELYSYLGDLSSQSIYRQR